MTRHEKPSPPGRAKLFPSGGSQAVRLPRAFRFEGDEVRISRDGDKVILEPIREPPSEEEVLAWLASIRMPDFMGEGREPLVLEERDWSLDDETPG